MGKRVIGCLPPDRMSEIKSSYLKSRLFCFSSLLTVLKRRNVPSTNQKY